VSEDKPEAYARIAKEDMMEEVSLWMLFTPAGLQGPWPATLCPGLQ
jgi:hypothetical protein